MRRRSPPWSLALVFAMGASSLSAAADPTPAPTATPAAIPGTPAANSTAADKPTRPRSKKTHDAGRSAASATAIATFPGFALLPDGGSRVYVQLTAPVGVQEHKSANELVYVLQGVAVPVRNNRNPLMTAHFNTPVTRARLVPTSKDVKLVIELRAAATPTHKLTTGTDGTTTLEIDFAPGHYVDEGQATAEPPPSDEPKPE